jgi:hypothetical protein
MQHSMPHTSSSSLQKIPPNPAWNMLRATPMRGVHAGLTAPRATPPEVGADVRAARLLPSVMALTRVAWVVMAGLYLLRTYFLFLDESYTPTMKGIFKGEHGVLDRTEAVIWLPIVALNAIMLVDAWRRQLASVTRLWFLGMTLACFVMAGEEVSWGQHVFGFAPPESVAQVNAQEEFNFHNLNLGQLMGLPPDHWLAPRLANFNFILNPAYYLFSIVVWIAIPLARERRLASWLDSIPTPSRPISTFLAANVVAFLLVDKLVFNAGEIFELALVSTYALATLEIYRRFRATGNATLPAPG